MWVIIEMLNIHITILRLNSNYWQLSVKILTICFLGNSLIPKKKERRKKSTKLDPFETYRSVPLN